MLVRLTTGRHVARLRARAVLRTANWVSIFERIGIRADVMGTVEYALGRMIAFVFVALMFFALYKYLPVRRIRTRTAWVATAFTSLAFEAARTAFSFYTAKFDPGSLYTTTISAIVVVIVWFYYASVIFILGGEVAQVYELRRVRRQQREVFTD